jgi:hypothetical protein
VSGRLLEREETISDPSTSLRMTGRLQKPEAVRDLSIRPVASLTGMVFARSFLHQAVELAFGSHLPVPIVIRPILEQGIKLAAFLPGKEYIPAAKRASKK